MKADIILLDNGHGKETPGKRSPVWSDGSQIFEYKFNRDIVRRIAEYFKLDNRVKILVPEITDIALPARVNRANKIALNNKGKQVLLISIHANAGGGSGWEVWTSKGETKSDAFATILFNEANAKLSELFPLRKDLTDKDPDKEEQFYILKNTVCPAILSENLFMDTEKDCRFIMSEAGRQTIAKIHIDFIKSILQ